VVGRRSGPRLEQNQRRSVWCWGRETGRGLDRASRQRVPESWVGRSPPVCLRMVCAVSHSFAHPSVPARHITNTMAMEGTEPLPETNWTILAKEACAIDEFHQVRPMNLACLFGGYGSCCFSLRATAYFGFRINHYVCGVRPQCLSREVCGPRQPTAPVIYIGRERGRERGREKERERKTTAKKSK
jgi:hypothetical protein